MKIPLWTTLPSTICNRRDDRLKKNKARKNASWGKSNVKEEYEAAFRTNSYIEITTTDTSSAPCLFQPDEDLILHDMSFQSSHIDLLVHYFETSFQAFETCQLLLQALHQTKINHALVKRSVINLTRRASEVDNYNDDDNDDDGVVNQELASFSHLENPFSIASHTHFLALHDTHLELLHDLTHKRNETRRKLRLKKVWKKVGKTCFMISNAAVLAALLVLALHSLIGVVAAPGLLIGCFISLPKKKKDCKLVSSELVLRQIEIAMKATYIMMNNLDTLSRMAARLEGEAEHLKAIGKMWMRNSRIRSEILKEAVAEDDTIVEQTKELEKHIYLCFLTINRSRRLVMKEVMGDRDQNG